MIKNLNVNISEAIHYTGEWEIKIKNVETGEIKIEKAKNRIVNNGLDELIKGLVYSTYNDLKIRKLAVGSSSTAISNYDTALYGETFRCSPSVEPYHYSVGTVATEFVIQTTEANGTIEEIGIFISPTATVTANTGILLSRMLWHHIKTSAEEITFTRLDSMQRV
jgi:hypothetical protein